MEPVKILPHNLDAEEAVSGSLLIDGAAFKSIDSIIVDSTEFYNEANGAIFEVCRTLSQNDTAINQITVAHELNKIDKLQAVGGPAYLIHLASICPTSLDIEYYAKIVHELAMYRNLIEYSGKVAALGYEARDLDLAIEKSDTMLLELRKKTSPPALVTPKIRAETMLQRYEGLKDKRVSVSSGLPTMDKYLGGGFFNGEFIIVGARPSMGKTALLQTMANNQCHKYTILFCSLEMSIGGITDRDVAGIIEVPVGRIRVGEYDEILYYKIYDAMGEIEKRQIYFLEAGNVTTARLYKAALEMKLRHKLDMIYVDYIGILADEKGENENARLGYISRRLKNIAREIDVPIAAAHQLSRRVEQREDRRPHLSDLRECLTGDTIVMSEWGTPVKIVDFKGKVLALDDRLNFVGVDAILHRTGVKQVYEIKTKTGQKIKATLDHKFMTPLGFKAVGILQVGDRIASPSKIPSHPLVSIDSELCRLLGYLLGDGGLTKQRSVSWTEVDKEVISDGVAIVKKYFPDITPKIKWDKGAYKITFSQKGFGYKKNPLINWLRDIGVWGQYSHEREIPSPFFEAESYQIEQLLCGLFIADGSAKSNGSKSRNGKALKATFDTNSEVLCDQVRFLLLKLGIVSSKSNGQKKGDYGEFIDSEDKKHIVRCNHDMHRLTIGRSSIGTFAKRVGFIGEKQKVCEILNSNNSDSRGWINRYPIEFTEYIYRKKEETGKTWKELGCYVWKDRAISKIRLGKFAETLQDEKLKLWANSDIWWDEVKSIKPFGEEITYDLEVPQYHNFIANGLVCHNSGHLEEDADVAMFIYRESYYKKESENKDTEIIIAKNRQGEAIAFPLSFNPLKQMYYCKTDREDEGEQTPLRL